MPRAPKLAKTPAGDAGSQNNFEASIARLQQIVEQLESGTLPLDESLQLFEEGIRLTRESQSQLDAAERRVEELLSVDEQGQATLREVEAS
jgi:exodeoxyribonuclease VII small subunit